jgi:hypothetical protein
MENIDEKRLELLRNQLSVYESEGIQCQLIFENRRTTLNVNSFSFFSFYEFSF